MKSITKPILLPDLGRAVYAVTNTKLRRLFFIYCALFVFAMALLVFTPSRGIHTFAYGLFIPGGGFLEHIFTTRHDIFLHALLFLLSLFVFGFGLVIWFATGNVLAPPFIWFLLALFTVFLHQEDFTFDAYCSVGNLSFWAVPLLTSSLIALGYLLGKLLSSHQLKKRRLKNEYLLKCEDLYDTGLSPSENKDEFSLRELKQMRFILDRALQPIQEFGGFEWYDQFQTAAVRYQLNFMGYALSMAQYRHLPAFGGYLNQAQHNLLIKLADYRVWKYWHVENLWGNLKNNSDPIPKDNIMFTGFCATQMAMFQATSNRDVFLKEGSFSLKHPSGQIYAYNLNLLVGALDENFRKSDYYLMACEPNWVYSLCNLIGAAGIKAHDDKLWQQHDKAFRFALESEFFDIEGRFIACRSNYTGLAFPAIGGVMPQAMPCYYLNAIYPDIAYRQWLLVRSQVFAETKNGKSFKRSAFWPIDTGNYRLSRAASYSATALAAVEMGDAEVAGLCFKALEEACPSIELEGVIHRPNASVWAHAVEFLARSGAVNAFRLLIADAGGSIDTPKISDVPYPDVLVAHASYNEEKLRAVFYPGNLDGIYPISFANLKPNMIYDCFFNNKLATLQSDDHGQGVLSLLINGRTELQLKLRRVL